MAKKEIKWRDISSPDGDASLFALEGKKYRIIGTLKENSDYGECKQLCRVSDEGAGGKDKFAVISSFIRAENGSFVSRRAILYEPEQDIESAMGMFESIRC